MESQVARHAAGPAWPVHIGVGGLSLVASRALQEDHSGSCALAALRTWPGVIAGRPVVPAQVESFPFAGILRHYQTVGRLQVAQELVTELLSLRGLLGKERQRQGDPAWLLAGWLVSATDQENGDYESYLGEDLLDRAIAASGQEEEEEEEEDAAVDTLIAALLADLTGYEAAALAEAPPSRRQRARIVAAVQALSRLGRLAPRAAIRPVDSAALHRVVSPELHVSALAGLAHDAAASVLAAAATPLRRAADVTMLPITPLHDEYMFLRCVQIFELLYWQIVRCLGRAGPALLDGDPVRVCVELAAAAWRLEATPALYRVLTTMPQEAFAIIRGLTNGRSAIQSRPYRLVEMVSAPRELSAEVRDKIPQIEVTGPTLQEVFEKKSRQLGSARMGEVAEAMARLDTAWRAMKRTHWGITLKIIGDVPGTGGTTGVHYLEAGARIPLFPLLEEAGGLSDDRR